MLQPDCVPDLMHQGGEKQLRIARPGKAIDVFRPGLLGHVDVQVNERQSDGHELRAIRRGRDIRGGLGTGEGQQPRRQFFESDLAGRHRLHGAGNLQAAESHPET